VKRGQVVGYEALSRFRLEPRVSPDVVFAEAERQGLGARLDAVVVTRALELAQTVPANCFLSVNVEPRHLLGPELLSVLTEPKSLGGIVLELTEHREVSDVRALIQVLDRLRERGAIIAVDDAGSGYSGLRQLLELRPQLIKLDRELVTNLHDDTAKIALIQMLGELVGRLDGWLLAEGVETANELRVLQQLGVPLAQGYFLAKPAPPWTGLLPQAHDLLQQREPSLGRIRIAQQLLEPCAVCAPSEAWPSGNLTLRLSPEGRPLAMRFEHDGSAQLRLESELLRVKPSTLLAQIAERAVTRPERLRWDPIVCIDEAGHFVGIVRLHRLVSALARTSPADSPRLSVAPN
ncbi:MAG TPA: EAL domain-containing protein, partial [Polyangiaceae bacterium]|nr:EAL domain-containing protein [Polyangiaceae bacterium]